MSAVSPGKPSLGNMGMTMGNTGEITGFGVFEPLQATQLTKGGLSERSGLAAHSFRYVPVREELTWECGGY